MQDTIDYYEQNAEAFIEDTLSVREDIYEYIVNG